MRRTQSQKGQGMTEYILIVALIAVFVIGAVKLLGKNTKEGFKDAANQVGNNVQDAIGQSNKP
jgi:Flp pilus assembly pilin Flp